MVVPFLVQTFLETYDVESYKILFDKVPERWKIILNGPSRTKYLPTTLIQIEEQFKRWRKKAASLCPSEMQYYPLPLGPIDINESVVLMCNLRRICTNLRAGSPSKWQAFTGTIATRLSSMSAMENVMKVTEWARFNCSSDINLTGPAQIWIGIFTAAVLSGTPLPRLHPTFVCLFFSTVNIELEWGEMISLNCLLASNRSAQSSRKVLQDIADQVHMTIYTFSVPLSLYIY